MTARERTADRREEVAHWRAVRRCAERRCAALFAEPDCLTDPSKRAAFFAARRQYQEATLALWDLSALCLP